MKIFHCDHCGQLLFFENVQCLGCTRPLAYLPDLGLVGSLDTAGNDLWQSPLPRAQGRRYRLCGNYRQHNVCNWAVEAESPHELCTSCRLTRVIPDLNVPGNREAWYRLELAKRRLVYSLVTLGLTVENKEDDSQSGLTFEFLSDPPQPQPDAKPVLTGHAEGVITINLAEADDAEREKRRLAVHEPYRTLLGHFRHEVGHYYWDRLVRDGERLNAFRQLFGDEREDYAQALERHYQRGAPTEWQTRFVSAYASAHAWEDWAETWAHFIHMADALETATACGLSLRPARTDEPSLKAHAAEPRLESFQRMIDDWFPLTYVLNNLNRGLGLADAYPFVLMPPVIEKLRFIHETVMGSPAA